MATRTTPIVSTEYNRMLETNIDSVPIAQTTQSAPVQNQVPPAETEVEAVYERLRQISKSKMAARESEKKIVQNVAPEPVEPKPVEPEPVAPRVQPARAQQPAVNPPAPDPAAAIKSFWVVIAGFNWRNRSDGEIDSNVIGYAIEELTDAQKRDIATAYPILFKRLNKALSDRHFFDTRPTVVIEEFISHFIAMGEDMYKSAVSTDDFTEFIADAAEYQDFHKAVKNSLREVAAEATK